MKIIILCWYNDFTFIFDVYFAGELYFVWRVTYEAVSKSSRTRFVKIKIRNLFMFIRGLLQNSGPMHWFHRFCHFWNAFSKSFFDSESFDSRWISVTVSKRRLFSLIFAFGKRKRKKHFYSEIHTTLLVCMYIFE